MSGWNRAKTQPENLQKHHPQTRHCARNICWAEAIIKNARLPARSGLAGWLAGWLVGLLTTDNLPTDRILAGWRVGLIGQAPGSQPCGRRFELHRRLRRGCGRRDGGSAVERRGAERRVWGRDIDLDNTELRFIRMRAHLMQPSPTVMYIGVLVHFRNCMSF